MKLLSLVTLSCFALVSLQSATAQIIASSLVGNDVDLNLISYVNNATAFSSPGDGFAKFQIGISDSVPFALADDSISVFPTDSLGIIPENDSVIFFGVTDTENNDNTGPVSAVWTFDISSGGDSPLALSIDIGAMGEFEAEDTFVWEYSVDGNPSTVAFESTVVEGVNQTYTLGGGAVFELPSPLSVGGVELSNALQTVTTQISQTGSELVVTFTAVADGGSEALAFRNIVVSVDGSTPAPTVPPTPAPTISAEPYAIYEIQGSQQASAENALPQSPLVGTRVLTSGIVTGVDSNLFYLQDAAGDGDDSTSDAIVIFTGSPPTVALGDEVTVIGEVSEFFPGGESSGNQPTTQISADDIRLVSSGNDLPAPVLIGGANGRKVPTTSFIDAINFYESLESMRVTAVDTVVVAATSQFGEIFVVSRTDGVPDTGSPLSQRGTLNIADGDFNPEKIQIDEDSGLFNFDFPEVRVGDTLGDVTGIVGYSFGIYEILPTEDFTPNIVEGGLQPLGSDLEKSDSGLLVATYNVLNLDPNDDDGDADFADGRFDFIASQIRQLMNEPDIIALQEIQDNDGSADTGTVAADVTLQTLVDRIAANGGPNYSFIDNTFISNEASGGQPGGNIRTAYLYNPSRVELLQTETISGQGPGEAFEGARLPLVATFSFNEHIVTTINVHFSSKGGSAPIAGNEQPFETRQEEVTVNGSLDERIRQSQAVRNFITDLYSIRPDPNVIVLGDFNEFEFVSPVLDFTTDFGFYNLGLQYPESEIYTFEFQGNSQALDHIIVSPALWGDAGGTLRFVRANVEFPDTFFSGTVASDHDPLVAEFLLPAPQSEVPSEAPTPDEGSSVRASLLMATSVTVLMALVSLCS